ncbi:MAG: dephospho-CoA kinase [Chromatiales bacterium]
MLVVGLTGGIGSGKSSVAALFADLGVPVLDADRIAREAVAPGTAGLDAVVGLLGPEVLDARGRLDRGRVRERVFGDPQLRHRLEAIIHPRVRAELSARLRALDGPYALAVVPLLIEAGQTDLVDRILVVDLPEELQVRRACERDGVEPDQIRAIMGAQCSRAERLAAADDVIDNSGDPARLERLVRRLHERYAGSDRAAGA